MGMNNKYLCGILILGIYISTMPFAHGNLSGLPTNEADCLKSYELPIGDISLMTPENSCQENEKLPIDNGRCHAVYTKLQEVYRNAQNRLKQHCAEAPKLLENYNNCANNTASANCTQQQTNLQDQAKTFVDEHRANIQMLQTELDNAHKQGVDAAKQIAENIKDLEQVPVEKRNEESVAAADAGAKSTNQAIHQVHSGQKAAELIQIIEQVRNASSISGDDVGRVDSLPAMEVLTGAQMAKDLKADLSEFDRKLAQQQSDLKGASQKTGNSVERHATLTDNTTKADAAGATAVAANSAGAAASSMAGAGGAAANAFGSAAGGATGYSGYGSSESEYEYNNSVSNAASGNLVASKSGKNGTAKVATATSLEGKKVANLEGTQTSTGTSKLPGDRSALRDRLKQRLNAGSEGESANGETSQAKTGTKIGADGKPIANSTRKLGAGANLSSEELSLLTPGTRLGNQGFSLQGSETDASVQELVRDFEGHLEGEGRGLASEQKNSTNFDDIGSENGADLFLRMKDVFERCLKRGCVSASRGSS
jgi:hypothetical protein